VRSILNRIEIDTCVEHVRGIDFGFMGLIRVCIVRVTRGWVCPICLSNLLTAIGSFSTRLRLMAAYSSISVGTSAKYECYAPSRYPVTLAFPKRLAVPRAMRQMALCPADTWDLLANKATFTDVHEPC